jgi:HEAT repeat protein
MKNHQSGKPLASFSEENREVVEILRGEDDEERLDILEECGEVDDELAEELLRLLEADTSDEVRAAAAIALGPTLEIMDTELDDKGRVEDSLGMAPLSQRVYDLVVETLRRVTVDQSEPALVRRRAFEAAVRSPKSWQVEVIRSAWAGDDPDWRLTAVFGMGYVVEADFSAEIEAAFSSDSVELQGEAIRAAGLRELASFLPDVTAIAADESAPPELRYAAVEALGYLGDDDSVELLHELAESDDEALAAVAEEALQWASLDMDDADLDDEEE